jgi:hypothetical protein
MNAYFQLATLLAQSLAAMILLSAGCSKLVQPAAIQRTLRSLELPFSLALALALGILELTAGLALILLPGERVTAVCIAVLAVAFACAASVALLRGVEVDCACLGSSDSSPLGWRQLAFTPVWLAIGASVLVVPAALPEDRPALALVVILIVSIEAIRKLIPLLVEHRIQRTAIDGS